MLRAAGQGSSGTGGARCAERGGRWSQQEGGVPLSPPPSFRPRGSMKAVSPGRPPSSRKAQPGGAGGGGPPALRCLAEHSGCKGGEEPAALCLQCDMNDCYSRLRKLVPTIPPNKRVSKVEILQHVIDYILDLQLALETHPALLRQQQQQHPAGCPAATPRTPLTALNTDPVRGACHAGPRWSPPSGHPSEPGCSPRGGRGAPRRGAVGASSPPAAARCSRCNCSLSREPPQSACLHTRLPALLLALPGPPPSTADLGAPAPEPPRCGVFWGAAGGRGASPAGGTGSGVSRGLGGGACGGLSPLPVPPPVTRRRLVAVQAGSVNKPGDSILCR